MTTSEYIDPAQIRGREKTAALQKSGSSTSSYPAAVAATQAEAKVWKKAGTVNTINGPVDVDATGKTADGVLAVSAPVPFEQQPPATPAGSGSNVSTEDPIIAGLKKQIADLTNLVNSKNAPAIPTVPVTADPTATISSDTKGMKDILTARFKQYGLESLTDTIAKLAVDGATEAGITLALENTDAYVKRFAANTARVKAGLSYLQPRDYLNLEASYRQVLRAYGLNQFDTNAYVTQFISNDMSAQELSNRVVTAVQRVQNADPAVSKTLRDYYGVTSNDLVAYVLDPQQQFEKIKTQVASAEIGTAARVQGLEAGVATSEALARQGITQAEAQKGYASIADILPTAQKLSEIYGSRVGTYDQAAAEQEQFNSLASAQRTRKKLSETEVAQFGGSSGTSKGAFSTGYLNKQSSAGQF